MKNDLLFFLFLALLTTSSTRLFAAISLVDENKYTPDQMTQLKKSAHDGNSVAQYKLGVIYEM